MTAKSAAQSSATANAADEETHVSAHVDASTGLARLPDPSHMAAARDNAGTADMGSVDCCAQEAAREHEQDESEQESLSDDFLPGALAQ